MDLLLNCFYCEALARHPMLTLAHCRFRPPTINSYGIIGLPPDAVPNFVLKSDARWRLMLSATIYHDLNSC